MNWREHIHSDPEVLSGKPVIRGTRISVELILQYFAERASTDDVLRAYPHLSAAAVQAALAFAAQFVADETALARLHAA